MFGGYRHFHSMRCALDSTTVSTLLIFHSETVWENQTPLGDKYTVIWGNQSVRCAIPQIFNVLIQSFVWLGKWKTEKVKTQGRFRWILKTLLFSDLYITAEGQGSCRPAFTSELLKWWCELHSSSHLRITNVLKLKITVYFPRNMRFNYCFR